MPTVLIVSPHFPPMNTPDMQRVRMSLPYFAEFGWQPVVLAAAPDHGEGVQEPLLLATVPATIPIRRVGAVPARWTRRVGVGNLGLRAWPFLYRAGMQMIRQYRVDLVYFSTTQFPTMALGRLWKAQCQVPFVLDMQDPWVSDASAPRPALVRPLGGKHRLAQRLHRRLEPWTMRQVDGIIAVSEAYHTTLRARYPWIAPARCATIPFGATSADEQVAAQYPWSNPYFRRGDGLLHGVYAGVLGRLMQDTCQAICLALRQGLRQDPELFSRVRLHFIGTDYATDARASQTIAPLARQLGLGAYVQEEPRRVPYFAVLNLLREADFLLVPGSDNPQYTASKLYPYILARKPLLAVFHQGSSVVEVLRQTRAGEAVTFASGHSAADIARALLPAWSALLQRLPYTPDTDWGAFEPYTAREMTRRQCAVFDRVMASGQPCGAPQ